MSDSIVSLSGSGSVIWKTWIKKTNVIIPTISNSTTTTSTIITEANPVNNPLSHIALNNDIFIAYDNINYILWCCPITSISSGSEILSSNKWKSYNIKSSILNYSNAVDYISIYLNVLYIYGKNGTMSIPLNSGGINPVYPIYASTSSFNPNIISTTTTTTGANNATSTTITGANNATSTTTTGANNATSTTTTGANNATSTTTTRANNATSTTATGANNTIPLTSTYSVPSTTLISYNTATSTTRPITTTPTTTPTTRPTPTIRPVMTQENLNYLFPPYPIITTPEYNNLYISTMNETGIPNNSYTSNKITSSFFPLVKIL